MIGHIIPFKMDAELAIGIETGNVKSYMKTDHGI
jgi:hypothetical protein